MPIHSQPARLCSYTIQMIPIVWYMYFYTHSFTHSHIKLCISGCAILESFGIGAETRKDSQSETSGLSHCIIAKVKSPITNARKTITNVARAKLFHKISQAPAKSRLQWRSLWMSINSVRMTIGSQYSPHIQVGTSGRADQQEHLRPEGNTNCWISPCSGKTCVSWQ